MRLFVGVLALLPLALPSSAAAFSTDNPGPCTGAATLGIVEGDAHDHLEPSQHQGLYCRIKKVSFDPLLDALKDHEDSKLGEMDVKAGIAAVAIQEPVGGALFFDVTDPANPKFLSRFLHATCALGNNCGAYIELTPDGKAAVLSAQQTDLMPGLITGYAGQTPGVALIDLADPKNPVLAQEHQVASVQGVHTTRTHLNEVGPAPGLYAYILQNAVGVEIARIDQTPAGPRMVRVANIPEPDPDNIASTHDTFIQTDPTDKKVYLYTAGGFTYGFRVYDVTNPTAPTLLGEWDPTPECVDDWYSHTVDVTTVNGRRIVTMPAEQFSFGAASDAGGATCGTEAGNGDMPGTMWFVDATDFSKLAAVTDDAAAIKAKSEPLLITTWRSPTDVPAGPLTFSAHNQQIVGDRVYLSHYHGGIFVLDASGAFAGRNERPKELAWAVPYEPAVRPTIETGTFPHVRGDFWDMVFYNGHIIAADIKGGLYSLVVDEGTSGDGGAGGGGACTDTVAPTSRVARARLTRRGGTVTGRATDAGCGAKVTRVLAGVALQKGKKCRWIDNRGRVGKTSSCSKPKFLPAKGTASWSLKLRGRLPKGRYRVVSRALDWAGNVERVRIKSARVR